MILALPPNPQAKIMATPQKKSNIYNGDEDQMVHTELAATQITAG
jgi:hypothetical protein